MAFSFRISSFDFEFFDFLRRRDNSQRPDQEQPPQNTPPLIPDPNQSDMMFDMLSGVIAKDKPLDVKDSPGIQVTEVESAEVNLPKDDEKGSKRRKKRNPDSDEFDKVMRDLLRKFRREYREVRKHNMTNISYQLSHTELFDNKIYMGRFQDNTAEISLEEEKYKEKEKEKYKDDSILKDELKFDDKIV